jgi:hypothetical protein
MDLGSTSRNGSMVYDQILLEAPAQAQHHLHPWSIATSLPFPNLQTSVYRLSKRALTHFNTILKPSPPLIVLI